MKKLPSASSGLTAFGRAIASFVLFFMLAIPTLASASGVGQCSHFGGHGQKMLQLPDVHERRPYDVLAYDLSLDWRRPFVQKSSVYSGVQEMRIRVTEPTNVIVIDASLIRIDSAWVDGKRFDIAPNGANDQFRFTFANSLAVGHEFTLTMAFTRYMAAEKGAYFYPKDRLVGPDQFGNPVYTAEDLIYTQSEPFDAQYWMPCMNLPYDKSESRISIRVPEGLLATSNGFLDSTNSHTDGSKTFHWRSDKPIASYLMVANASKFVEWDETYARPSNPLDSVRAIYYAWPDDYDNTATDGSEYNPRHAFRNTVKILKEFSIRFGEYPFAQYGQVPVQPYGFGGMEHQGMTTVNRRWLRGFDESGIAHEIGHQWFGDKVTCETWDDLWLNEGFATYTEAIWAEINGGNDAYFNVVRGSANYYFQFGLPTASIFGPPALEAFGQQYAPLIYGKASAVIHLLRRYVNDDTLFFNAIRDYTDAFAYGHISTAKFEQYMSVRLGMDLTQFFKQWIYGAGTPHFAIKWNYFANSVRFEIEQQQDQDVFESPLRIFAENTDGTIDTFVVFNDARVQYFSIATGKTVSNIELDRDFAVLSTHEIERDVTMSVGEATASRTNFYVHGGMLSISNSAPVTGKLKVIDVIGRTVHASDIIAQQSQTIDLSHLLVGSYFVTLDSEGKRETYRFQR